MPGGGSLIGTDRTYSSAFNSNRFQCQSAFLTDTEADIVNSMNGVLADKTTHDTARQFAKLYNGRDKTKKEMDVKTVQFYCNRQDSAPPPALRRHTMGVSGCWVSTATPRRPPGGGAHILA